MTLLTRHREDLERLAAGERLRSLSPRRGRDFASNDYLGLAGEPRLAEAVAAALAQGVPIGSGGSRLLRGNDAEHEALEAEAAAFFGAESALFFANGFMANLALFGALPQRGDLVVHDSHIHASARDGMRLGRAATIEAAHNEPEAFEEAIAGWRRNGGTGRPWIAVDSLYSMDGDFAPLSDLAAIADRHEAMLIVDEAHATGLFGQDGRGLAGPLHDRENLISLHTCGKALGVEGALVCGATLARDFLINRGRSFIFTTAPSPLIARAVRESLRLVAGEPDRREMLWRLVETAGRRLARCGATVTGSQILPLLIGEDGPTMRLSQRLQAAGFDLRGIRPPTVAAGTSRLRISITVNVDEAAILALGDAIEDAMQ